MTTHQLNWRDLVPDTDSYQDVFSQPYDPNADSFATIQPRLTYGIEQLMSANNPANIMLIKAAEEDDYLNLIAEKIQDQQVDGNTIFGGCYHINHQQVSLSTAAQIDEQFASKGNIVAANWLEAEQLFGCVRQFDKNITLEPGLIHRANGGVLILSLRAILAQPLLWLRLKSMFEKQCFDWISPDETRPLPIKIPSLPLTLKLVLIGEREALADFQDIEPYLYAKAIYAEYEDILPLTESEDMAAWCQWVYSVAQTQDLPQPQSDAWVPLIREATRYSGDREMLPLCLSWIMHQLREIKPITQQNTFSAEQFSQMLEMRAWREGFLIERMQDEILQDQIRIDTEGEIVGQINALSVIEFPGHPRSFGEPSRITCVVHAGDGEFTDVERKAELAGNIHAKGMMIMHAFLMSELQLEQQMPFSASMTFEQSYSEVDGDSASMAELAALISALANEPIYQNIAITGSVDQFGQAQPVGGLNEKIEGFFRICQQRELTGTQGVIIPATNVRHLTLHQDILDAVQEGKFAIWAIDDIADALALLTAKPWQGEEENTLINAVQERIAQLLDSEVKHRYPLLLRWLNWFHPN